MTEEAMAQFESGATRHSEEGKLDYEGFLSPLVLRRYARYMHGHRKQADGKSRASDNWQKGIPLTAYMKSMWRHFMDLWSRHREQQTSSVLSSELEEALCAIIFNASGYLHEVLKEQKYTIIRDTNALINDPAEDCMPAPSKESLAALGTANAALAVEEAADPRHVLTPKGWKYDDQKLTSEIPAAEGSDSKPHNPTPSAADPFYDKTL